MPACRFLCASLLGLAGLGAAAPHCQAQPGPAIQSLAAQVHPRLEPGTGLEFTLRGTPGGRASLTLAGGERTVVLTEERPGEYLGRYTVRRSDGVNAASLVRARLVVGGRTVTSSVPLVPPPKPVSAPAAQHDCAACGVVQLVQVVEVEGRPSYAGPMAGGLSGAVLGSQIGEGSGSRLAGVLGAVGGAYVGREGERRPTAGRRYEVTVRLAGGGVQTVTLDKDPALAVGARVRIIEGGLLADD
ncbi:MAG: hypothetical protein RJA36_2082 [Pseudomonadota bacterium]|jgi:outer membrane lipoprotein SlyB